MCQSCSVALVSDTAHGPYKWSHFYIQLHNFHLLYKAGQKTHSLQIFKILEFNLFYHIVHVDVSLFKMNPDHFYVHQLEINLANPYI